MRQIVLWIVVLGVVALIFVASTLVSEGDYGGTDALIERVAERFGRSARAPFLNTDQGALHWVFAGGGLVAGFAIGYYMKQLSELPDDHEPEGLT